MAPIPATDLIAPKGEIDQSFFPSDNTPEKLEARVQAYLDEGYTKVTGISGTAAKDRAASEWALYRAAKAVYLRLSALPSSVDIPSGGSHQYLVTQMNNFKELAESHLDEFNALLPASVAVVRDRLPNPIYAPTVIIP